MEKSGNNWKTTLDSYLDECLGEIEAAKQEPIEAEFEPIDPSKGGILNEH